MSDINLSRFVPEALRAIANRHVEQSDKGVLFPRAGVFIGGFFKHAYAPPGGEFGPWAVEPNRVVTEGLSKILNLLAGHASSAALYIAPWANDVAPAANWKGNNWASLAGEFTAYSPATRPPWTTVQTSNGQVTNEAALAAATITFNAGGPYTVRGTSLCEAATKNATTGALVAASRFGSALTGMMGGGKLGLQYDLQAMDEGDA